MKFAKVVTFVLGAGSVLGAPAVRSSQTDIEQRDEELNAIKRSIQEYSTSLTTNGLRKRSESDFFEGLTNSIRELGLHDHFNDLVVRDPIHSEYLSKAVIRGIRRSNIPFEVISRGLKDADLLPRFLDEA